MSFGCPKCQEAIDIYHILGETEGGETKDLGYAYGEKFHLEMFYEAEAVYRGTLMAISIELVRIRQVTVEMTLKAEALAEALAKKRGLLSQKMSLDAELAEVNRQLEGLESVS